MLEGYLFPLLDEKHNARANIQMNGWKAIASHFAVWDYTINFGEAYQTFPNWMASYENLKSYYDYGYIDIYNQGNGTSTNLSFYYLDMWVRSRLLWDIHLDYESLMNEFIDAYYGEGAQYVRDYIERLTFHYLNHMQPMGYNGAATAATTTIKNYPISFVEDINNRFGKGINEIKNSSDLSPERKDTLVKRLEYESVFFRYVEITLYSSYFSREELIDPTAAYALYTFQFPGAGNRTTGVPYIMAACILVALPIIILFLIFKKKIIGTATVGGLKG